jgi:hypothetical protein
VDLSRTIITVCGIALVTGLMTATLLSDTALLDWDTYQRIQFITRYDATGVDTHVLYHALLLGLIDMGVSPVTGVFAITSGSVGLLAATAWWVAAARGLRGRARGLVL